MNITFKTHTRMFMRMPRFFSHKPAKNVLYKFYAVDWLLQVQDQNYSWR